jgi:hypothetical protein
MRLYNIKVHKMNMMLSDELQVVVLEEQNKHEVLNRDNASNRKIIRLYLFIIKIKT